MTVQMDPGRATALRDALVRRVDRSPSPRARWLAAGVTAVVLVTGAVLLGLTFGPSAPPGTGQLMTATEMGSLRTPGFLPESNLQTGRSLSFEAPSGAIQWTMNDSCQVTLHWLLPQGGSSSAKGSGCPFAPHLSIGFTGGFAGHGASITAIGGRTNPGDHVQVRITLHNGAIETLTPEHSSWLALVQRCGDVTGTAIKNVQLTASDGRVVASVDSPFSAAQETDMCTQPVSLKVQTSSAVPRPATAQGKAVVLSPTRFEFGMGGGGTARR
jgi:hypothetical protein